MLHSFNSAVVNAYVFHHRYCWFCKYVSILIHSSQEKQISILDHAPNISPVLVAILQHVCAVQHKLNAAEESSPTVPGLQALHKIIRSDSITVNLTNSTTQGRPQGSGLWLRRILMLASLCVCVWMRMKVWTEMQRCVNKDCSQSIHGILPIRFSCYHQMDITSLPLIEWVSCKSSTLRC